MKKAKVVRQNDFSNWCCWGGKGFPTFAVIVLLIGVSWLLNDLNIFTFKIPWLPIILIVLAISWIVDSQRRKL